MLEQAYLWGVVMTESISKIKEADPHKSDPESNGKPFEFKGDGLEYFKIWMVNILLTILTLGIYSAWAKVRNNRYFYSNLYLDGHSFEYLAKPVTILKGRVIAIIVFVIYFVLSQVSPIAAIGLPILLLLSTPWIVVRSLMFNRRMSAYRNVQFRFHGQWREAAMALVIWPIVGLLTLGIMFPYALLQFDRFIVRNSAFGTAKLDYRATLKQYVVIVLVAIGIILSGGIGLYVLAGVSIVASVLSLVLYAFVFIYTIVSFTNLYYNSVLLSTHEMEASLKIWPYTKVQIINFTLIILTLGLYLPAAKVRTTKYISDNIVFIARDSLEGFVAAEKEQISALGEELGEVFDFDIGGV